MTSLPLIDIAPLVAAVGQTTLGPAEAQTAAQIDRACRHQGFFLVTGHGVEAGLITELDRAARRFFALEEHAKAEIAMARGGRAWRGWFALDAELTGGRPDHKEGLYFGADLDPDDPRVRNGLPLHGPNLYPSEPASLRPAVEAWMAAMTEVGRALVRGIGIGLGLGPTWFDLHLTAEPTVLARIFRYPAGPAVGRWGVAEHTDYGLVTILAHDGRTGLEVRSGDGWQKVPATEGTLVVNLGDMLEALTSGRYRSTPHRVGTPPDARRGDRLSFPFFFDPSWGAQVGPLPLDHLEAAEPQRRARWDGRQVDDWRGRYGDYLTTRVAQVFPALGADVLGP